MRQQPQSSEVGVASFGEDAGKICLDPGRPREAGVVAQNAQRVSVGHQAPQRLVDFVQVLLGQTEGGSAPAAIAELGQGRFQTSSGWGNDNGDAPTLGREADGKSSLADLDGPGRCQ
jgi:hypothetical protein